MKISHPFFAGLFFSILTPWASFAQAWDIESLVTQVQSDPEGFPKFEFVENGLSEIITCPLDGKNVVVDGKYFFDGFRFTAPKDVKDQDFVWAFNSPTPWAMWYILPITPGEEMQGFQDFLYSDALYKGLDIPGEENRFRSLQHLTGTRFQPGQDYLIWFRRTLNDPPGDLRFKMGFVPSKENWDHSSTEEALKLKWYPMSVQVEALDSRGGRMLLNPEFFDQEYTASRIKSVFTSIRQTWTSRGGFFITMETATPPCRPSPSYQTLASIYGKADFEESEEQRRKRMAYESPDEEMEIDSGTTYFYDYFAFEVGEDGNVERVRTQAINYANLQPDQDGPGFGELGMKNLKVFYNQGKEVGRVYYFDEGSKTPFISTEPPPGSYKRGNHIYEYLGEGNWVQINRNSEGNVIRKLSYKDHQLNGRSEGFYDNGKTLWVANYLGGRLHGDVLEFDEDGELRLKRSFNQGEALPDEEAD